MFVIRSKRVSELGYQTLFNWMMTTPSVAKHPIRRFVESSPILWVQRLLYMSVHLVFTIVTGALAVVYWQHFALNTAFLLAMFGHSLWNGGTYYFDYFSKQYQRILLQSIVHAPSTARADMTALTARANDLLAAASVPLPSAPSSADRGDRASASAAGPHLD